VPRANARSEGFDPLESREGNSLRCVCWSRDAPHELQNFAAVLLAAPHAGHGKGRGFPQASQNLAVAGLSKSQLAHRMTYIVHRYACAQFPCCARKGTLQSIIGKQRTEGWMSITGTKQNQVQPGF
jgi:hypothetical protein